MYSANTHVLYNLIINIAIVDQNQDIVDVIDCNRKITIVAIPNEENAGLLKTTFPLKFLESFFVQGIDICTHMSFITPDNIWVSDSNDNLILTNTSGENLYQVRCYRNCYGKHTVSSDRELIYIDNNNDIKKLSEDLKLTKNFFETKNSRWHPLCVHCCKLTGDILVGTKRKKETQTIDLGFSDLDENENQGNLTSCKVTRYNKTGEETLTIQLNNNGLQLYKLPIYITENKNGDVVVSDNKDAVVVTDRGGKHRFTYTRLPSGSKISPRGVCTDSLSHILVIDVATQTVIMINHDGHFLYNLLTNSQELHHIGCLSYDFQTSRLWVGSWKKNRVSVYRYIDRPDALTGKSD